MTIRRLLIALQFFLAACAVLGGAALILRPDGSMLHLEVAALNGVFDSYWYPGIALLGLGMTNGVGGWLMWKHMVLDSTVSACAGGLTVIWIATQIVFMGPLSLQQLFFGGVGFVVFALATELVHEGHGPGWLPSEEQCAARNW